MAVVTPAADEEMAVRALVKVALNGAGATPVKFVMTAVKFAIPLLKALIAD